MALCTSSALIKRVFLITIIATLCVIVTTEPLGCSSLENEFFDDPRHGRVMCSSVCPPVKAATGNLEYCRINCPWFFNCWQQSSDKPPAISTPEGITPSNTSYSNGSLPSLPSCSNPRAAFLESFVDILHHVTVNCRDVCPPSRTGPGNLEYCRANCKAYTMCFLESNMRTEKSTSDNISQTRLHSPSREATTSKTIYVSHSMTSPDMATPSEEIPIPSDFVLVVLVVLVVIVVVIFAVIVYCRATNKTGEQRVNKDHYSDTNTTGTSTEECTSSVASEPTLSSSSGRSFPMSYNVEEESRPLRHGYSGGNIRVSNAYADITHRSPNVDQERDIFNFKEDTVILPIDSNRSGEFAALTQTDILFNSSSTHRPI